jgi:hypothetical protein
VSGETQNRVSTARRAWLSPLLYSLATLVGFGAFFLIGRTADSAGTRVLGALDPAFSVTKAVALKCLEWLWGHPTTIGIAVTGLAATYGILLLLLSRRRALLLLLLPTGFVLATWGQLVLWRKGATPAGIGLYLGGVLCAAVLGRVYPMARLAGFPTFPSSMNPPPTRKVGRSLPPSEWALVFGLTIFGLLVRGYALTELPPFFDGETIPMMVGSYTGYGIRNYLMTEFLGTGNGIFHVATHYVLYHLLGASIFTIRLVSVFWGVLAIPLLYWLARRIAGRGAAIAATVLFITAPEQLFWSRSDNTFFAPVAVLALVTAHLCLSMQQQFTPRAVLAVALWMPFCRYSYTPSWVLFTLPILLAVHAAVFVRGAFQRLRYVAPILLGGLLLWVFSLSVVEHSLQPENGWRFINPTKIRGEAAWRHDIREDAGPIEVLREQSLRVARNAGYVLAGMTYHAKYSTHWYGRYFVNPDHNTVISAGLAVLCALGIGYLFGQLPERRAALLLIWILIGLLPGCMSTEPEARRISVAFPALPIVVGVFTAASVRFVRENAGRWGARATMATLGLAVGATAFAGLSSNLLLTTVPPRVDDIRRFAKPLFERCDLVMHNVVTGADNAVQIASLDTLVKSRSGRCSQFVNEKDWPGAALLPRCDFSDPVFRLTLPPQEIKIRRKSYRPTRIGYLLKETPESKAHVELLRRLFPAAQTREFPGSTPEERLFAMEVPLSEIDALRAPEVSAKSEEAALRARAGLLQGVELAVGTSTAPQLTIRGGVLLPEKDWYRFRLEPACSHAELTAGTPLSASAEPRPLLAGVHPFAIRLRENADCRLPLTLWIESARRPDKRIPATLLAPRVVEAAQAVAVAVIPGYGESKGFARLTDHPVDVGVDRKGYVFVLAIGQEGLKLHRFAPDGKEEMVSRTELPRDGHASLSVDPDGNCILVGLSSVEIRDRSGRLLQSWKTPYDSAPSDAALLPDGRIILCFPSRNAVEIFSREGRLEGSLARAGERLTAPTGVAVASDGTIVVVEETELARVFRSPVGQWPPAQVGVFPVAYPEVPFPPDLAACAFDGTNRILFPHHSLATPLIYDLKGRPLMASAPAYDLSAKGLKDAHGFCSTRDALYVLDSYPFAVIRVARK